MGFGDQSYTILQECSYINTHFILLIMMYSSVRYEQHWELHNCRVCIFFGGFLSILPGPDIFILNVPSGSLQLTRYSM